MVSFLLCVFFCFCIVRVRRGTLGVKALSRELALILLFQPAFNGRSRLHPESTGHRHGAKTHNFQMPSF